METQRLIRLGELTEEQVEAELCNGPHYTILDAMQALRQTFAAAEIRVIAAQTLLEKARTIFAPRPSDAEWRIVHDVGSLMQAAARQSERLTQREALRKLKRGRLRSRYRQTEGALNIRLLRAQQRTSDWIDQVIEHWKRATGIGRPKSATPPVTLMDWDWFS